MSTPSSSKEQLSSNELALIRTALANERTYLAFVRSGFAAIGLGIKLETMYPTIIGVGFVIAGMFGYYRVKFTLRRAGVQKVLTSNLIMEIVVFACLLIIYWAYKRRGGKK